MTALRAQANVLRALMLRDIRTRFFGHGLGYVFAVGWPLAHIVILLALYNVTQRVAPIGSSLTLYFATSLAPVIAFIYGSRWIMFSAVTNKTLLYFPLVKIFDVLLARALLEAAASCFMVIVLLIALTALGIDVRPVSAPEAMKAMAAAIVLGVGLGFITASSPSYFHSGQQGIRL
jgi:capsular polysaccharide transport system permease protein